MSLLGHGGDCGEVTGKFQECKRDFEREITNAKLRWNAYEDMLEQLIEVADNKYFYSISDGKTKRSMAAMIGAAHLEVIRWEANVSLLIRESEKEQEK